MTLPNDADLQTARLTGIANGLAKARKAGHCSHGRWEGDGGPWNPAGEAVCLECGKKAVWEILEDERRELLIEWT